MAIDGYIPKIALPSGEEDHREGDGIGLIYTAPDGKKKGFACDLFQGGGPTNAIARWFMKNGVYQIEKCVLTHGHSDHGDGIIRMAEGGNVSVKEVLCYDPNTLKHGGSTVAGDINYMFKLIRRVQATGTVVHYIDHGSTVTFGDITFRVYREQPTKLDKDDTYGWSFVNDGSLVLYSPELQIVLPGDGPEDQERMLIYFGGRVIAVDITHHGNSWTKHNAVALKKYGCLLAWESCVEKNGPGTSEWTAYGARRILEQGIPVWMQNEDIYFHAESGVITFTQGNKRITTLIPYAGKGDGFKMGWAKDDNGWKYYSNAGKALTGWHKLKWSGGTHWFFFEPDGYMVTGWQYLDWSGGKNWFFFDYKNGWMKTGWIFVETGWYYLDPESGAMKTGWLKWKNRWCYLEPVSNKNQGHCYIDCEAEIDGKKYRFDKDGYAEEINTEGQITVVNGKLNQVSASRRQFVIDIANLVRKYAPSYDIKVYSPIISQAIHESGWGESKLAAKYHNYFGLKCGTKWKGRSVNMKTQEEYTAGSLTTISANFRAYDSMEEGVKGYFEFIQLPRYSNLKGVTSPRQYLQRIKDDGYATGSQYVEHNMNTINMYDLTQFDVPVATTDKSLEDPIDVLIRIMEAEVGTHEGANNQTKYGDEMHAIQPRNMDKNAAWCDAFFDWCILKLCEYFGYGADMARQVLCGDFDDYTYASVALYKKAGRWSSAPHRGDQIFFGGSGHTGGVISVSGGTENTIEGNKGDEVRKCSYSIHSPSIIGYGRPRYYLLTGKPTAADMPLLKKGATGVDVETLQKMLIAKGYSCGESGADGSFGNATLQAVKRFQNDSGLEADGEVGPLTWGKLFDNAG